MNATDPLHLLLSRCSVGTRQLQEPAPTDEELHRMVQAALRAPDHAGLVPYRFHAIRGSARDALADLFEQAALDAGKDATQATRDRDRALGAPLLLAVVARIDQGHPVAGVHEQWMAVGGAVTNLLNAVHALGYAGKMLSGSKVRAGPVVAAFCGPGETLVGWVVLGTTTHPGRRKFDKPAPQQVLVSWDGC
ncbi:nitroreductase [uncultured Hydrogenophaga sp.]|uniref:nitroreductase family protein n=1 Tax=uncultured Hydrogenophaga sp. TaxID=199683 RepID=UPI00265E7973|nr:nitroreductase [uncultured Hydrogenophaga sp.]